MYKGASQSLQRAHAVDKPHPSRGYIDGSPDARGTLPDVGGLSTDDLRAEQSQLRNELKRIEQQMLIAKTVGNKPAVELIGQQKVALQARISAVNKTLSIKTGPTELRLLGLAIREIAGDELANQIFERSRELRTELSASAIEARRAETRSGSVADESAVGDLDTVEGIETPNDHRDSSHD